MAIASGKYLFSRLIESAIEKRSVKYVVQKAIQEGTKAVRAGGSDAAIRAAEKRLMANSNVTKILRKELAPVEVNALRMTGIIAILTGTSDKEEG